MDFMVFPESLLPEVGGDVTGDVLKDTLRDEGHTTCFQACEPGGSKTLLGVT